MALITPGTKCKICGKPLKSGPVVAFGHFVGNRKDPLSMFSDSAFHPECFAQHPLRERASVRREQRREKNRHRACVVCGETIVAGSVTTDFVTDDPAEELREFNFLWFHREHLQAWSELSRFRLLLRKFFDEGKYDGPPLWEAFLRETHSDQGGPGS